MRRHSWQQAWIRCFLWVHVLAVVGFYVFAWWHAPFSKKDRAHVKKLAAQKFLPSSSGAARPMVSIIVPARNEERNIRRCVESLLKQDYASYEIIVVNDDSTDETRSILEELARAQVLEGRLHLLHLQELPHGWVGKPHAIHMGVQKAQGEWLLFTDADTWHRPNALRISLTLAEERQGDLLTLGPKQELFTFWERVMMPLAYAATSIRFPIKRVNNPKSRVASANGQYILIRRKSYEVLGGYYRPDLRRAMLDDIELGRILKENGLRLHFVDGRDLVHVRMYSGLSEAWQGWIKNAFLAKRGGLAGALIELFELPMVTMVPFLLPLFALVSRTKRCRNVRSLEISIAAFIEITVVLVYRTWLNRMLQIRWYYIFTHFLAGILFEGILAQSTWKVLAGRGLTWRNREYHNL